MDAKERELDEYGYGKTAAMPSDVVGLDDEPQSAHD